MFFLPEVDALHYEPALVQTFPFSKFLDHVNLELLEGKLHLYASTVRKLRPSASFSIAAMLFFLLFTHRKPPFFRRKMTTPMKMPSMQASKVIERKYFIPVDTYAP